MSVSTFLTLNGDRTDVPDAALSAFQDRMRGEVSGADSADYDAHRTLWNTMIDRQPTRIARCRGAADVIATIDFAREHDLLCSVRGGGHNVAGKAVADDTLMIDLSPMRDITPPQHLLPLLAHECFNCGLAGCALFRIGGQENGPVVAQSLAVDGCRPTAAPSILCVWAGRPS